MDARAKRATSGFVNSLVAGILILVNGVVRTWVEDLGLSTVLESALGNVVPPPYGLIFGVLVIIGAILIYMPGKEIIGGISVLIFSTASILVGGGFITGFILGIVGGALGIAKK